MNLEEHIPSGILRPFIKRFMFIESEQEMENFVLPDTSTALAIVYKGQVSMEENGKLNAMSSAVFSGLTKSARLIKYSNQTSNLLVIFQPGGASAFFREPLNELFGERLQADLLQGHSDLRNIAEQLSETKNKADKLSLVERILTTKLNGHQTDQLISSSVEKIKSSKGYIQIHQLAKELYISQDSFEKRFRQKVGTTPKQFSRIIRLRNAINTHSHKKNLTETALDAGYFDQAHFIKDFKLFTGKTPREFFSSANYW